MTENFPSAITLGEGIPRGQIGAFEDQGRRLFRAAKQPFSPGRTSAERAASSILSWVLYETKERNLVAITDSTAALKAEGVSGSVAVIIETSLPWSLAFPNAYIRERFQFAGFGESEAYDYSLGVSEYSLEGDPIQGHTLEDTRSAYPKATEPFQPECTPEHFTDQLLTMAQLQTGDEVGCEPNPYRQVYRG